MRTSRFFVACRERPISVGVRLNTYLCAHQHQKQKQAQASITPLVNRQHPQPHQLQYWHLRHHHHQHPFPQQTRAVYQKKPLFQTQPKACISTAGAREPWAVLGVEQGATTEEVKKAFRSKAIEYHPDKPTGDARKFREIKEAMETIMKIKGSMGPGAYGSSFGGSGIQFRRRGPTAGSTEAMDLQREVEEMMRNIERARRDKEREKKQAFAANASAKRRQSNKVVGEFRSIVQYPYPGATLTQIERLFLDGRVHVEKVEIGRMTDEDLDNQNAMMRGRAIRNAMKSPHREFFVWTAKQVFKGLVKSHRGKIQRTMEPVLRIFRPSPPD